MTVGMHAAELSQKVRAAVPGTTRARKIKQLVAMRTPQNSLYLSQSSIQVMMAAPVQMPMSPKASTVASARAEGEPRRQIPHMATKRPKIGSWKSMTGRISHSFQVRWGSRRKVTWCEMMAPRQINPPTLPKKARRSWRNWRPSSDSLGKLEPMSELLTNDSSLRMGMISFQLRLTWSAELRQFGNFNG